MLLLPAAVAAQGGYETDPTRKMFVAEADPLCRDANKRSQKLFDPIEKLVRKGKLKEAGRKLIKGERIQLALNRDLAELDRPPADAKLIGRWLAITKRGVKTSIDAGRDLRDEKLRRAARKLEEADELFTKANRKVRGFGFESCA
jgi:hypothetical protein